MASPASGGSNAHALLADAVVLDAAEEGSHAAAVGPPPREGRDLGAFAALDPWVRGVPQALALFAMMIAGSESFFGTLVRGSRFWGTTGALVAIVLALPWLVHALRDPARGPRRACPVHDVRAALGWLAAFVAAVLVPMALAGSFVPQVHILGCALMLYPFFGLAAMRAFAWAQALGEASRAARAHRGSERFWLHAIDAANGTIELERGAHHVLASLPPELLRGLAGATWVHARLEAPPREEPYRTAPARVLSLESAEQRAVRIRDHAGAVLGLVRALLWAAIPFAVLGADALCIRVTSVHTF